jgi:uncharacterized protein YeaO (DUF488 family)
MSRILIGASAEKASFWRNTMLQVKRVYEPAEAGDGKRFLVERLWPRGMKKESLKMDGWIKDVAPSNELRHWFGHDPAKWEEFRRRYTAELKEHPGVWQPLLAEARHRAVTLLYSAHDEEHNNAIVLKSFLEEMLEMGGHGE